MSTEVRLLNVCRSLNLDATTVFLDPFDDASLSATNWPAPAPTWTLDGEVSSGFPAVSAGGARTNVANTMRAAVLNDRIIATSAYREVSISTSTQAAGNNWHILMDMNNTTPVPGTSVRLRGSFTGAAYYLTLYINNALSGTFNDQTGGAAGHVILRLTIDGNRTIKAYWKSATFPSITYTPTGYIPAGGRVGFALKAGANPPCFTGYFSHTYSIIAAENLPTRALIASANGKVYYENTDGNMIPLTTPVRTLASDRLLSSVNRLQKLYIADYGLAKYGTAGATNASPGTTFTDAAVSSWSALGVNAADYRLEVRSGTGLPTGVVGQGIGVYAIASVSGANLVLATTLGINATAITYRVLRGPKVFDAATLTLTAFPIGTIGASPGQVPIGCTIVSAWLDKLLWSGDPLAPNAVYGSKTGDPENYVYARIVAEAFVYDPNTLSGSANIGDAVTAIIPFNDDYFLIAGQRSIAIQRGDPNLGTYPEQVTRDAGIVDKQAWCYTPDGLVLGLSNDGLYLFTPGPNMMPERVSRDRLPKELIDINPALYDVQLQFDLARQGAKIFITPKIAGPTTHWWFDWTKKAFWPEELPSDIEPTASCVHSIGGSGTPAIILGSRTGYLRKEVDSQSTDDGTAITSNALLGPFNLGHPKKEGLVHEVVCEPATGSANVLVELLVGNTPQEARVAAVADSFTFEPGVPVTWRPRIRGGACFFRCSGVGNQQWAIESFAFDREVVGVLRA